MLALHFNIHGLWIIGTVSLLLTAVGCSGSDKSDVVFDNPDSSGLSGIIISEVSPSNTLFNDEDGDTEDWIEIFNKGESVVDLGGWSLTDDVSEAGKWVFPEVSLAPGRFLLIWASKKDKPFHASFKISSKGETVSLFDVDGDLIDKLDVVGLVVNKSIGRSTENESVVYYDTPTPGGANITQEFEGILQTQLTFSDDGGEFLGSSVAIEDAEEGTEIRYTLDASLPTRTSTLYSDPIEIEENTVIRARVFKSNFIPSTTDTRSYIVSDSHGLPIVTLVTDPANFFDEDIGIYELGSTENYDPDPLGEGPYAPVEGKRGANIWQDWERDIHFSFYESNGELGLAIDAGVKIFGGFSRSFAQRSLAIFARGRYGNSEIDYPLFPNLEYQEFQAVVLRNSGNDWLRGNMRDVVATSLMDGSGLETQAFRPVAVYLNGEYWGFYNLREKINEHFLDSKIDVKKSTINRLESNAEVAQGSNDDYLALLDFVRGHTLSDAGHYEYVANQIDVDNLIKYLVAQIYFDNRDWPSNNLKFWNSDETKWRWILYDTDFGFGHAGDSYYLRDSLAYALGGSVDGREAPAWSTFLYRRLLENAQFRNKLINQFADELNGRFDSEGVVKHIDSIAAAMESEMPKHFSRWSKHYLTNVQNGPPYEDGLIISWESRVKEIKNFAKNRVDPLRKSITDFFNITGTFLLKVNQQNPEAGFVHVNSLVLPPDNWEGAYFNTIPVSIKAVPNDGYEFSHWDGFETSLAAQIQINSDSDVTISPVFTKSEE